MNLGFHHYRGFTLIELSFVIVIVSILAVSASFLLQNTTITVGAQAEQLAGALRYTQSLSMTHNERYRWVKLSSTQYQIQDNLGVPLKLAQGNTTVTLNGNIVFGAFTNLPSNLVCFDGRGTPYSDTGSPGAALVSNATIPLTVNGETKTITIVAGTGGVLVS